MVLTKEMMREAGSKAFFALKKKRFYDSKTEGDLTTLSLFGDTYKFNFDSKRKIAWMQSEHHYRNCKSFKLSTRHNEWEGIFSYPRSVVHDEMRKVLESQGIKVEGITDNEKLGIQCRIIMCQAYKGDKKKLSRIFGGVLWKHYDYEVASLAMKVYGVSANSIDYSVIANNKEEFLDTLQKAPGILPVWRDLVLLKMYKDRKPLPPPPALPKVHDNSLEDEFIGLLGYFDNKKSLKTIDSGDSHYALNDNQLTFQLREEPYHTPMQIASSFNFPEEATTFVFPDIIKTAKTKLEESGLTPVGWRYLIKLPPRYVQAILVAGGGGAYSRNFAQLINWLAAIGVVPRYSLIKPILRNLSVWDKTDDFTAVMRSGLSHAQKMRRGVRTFFEDQLLLVMDWFSNSGEVRQKIVVRPEFGVAPVRYGGCRQVVLDKNQRKADWSWFVRQQDVWHQEMRQADRIRQEVEAAKLKTETKNDFWESLLPEFAMRHPPKSYRVIPLTNTHALIDEGKEMHHCVASYAASCIEGDSRVFSIFEEGENKVATLEIRNAGGLGNDHWRVNQCRGVCNKDVSDEVKSIANEVARRYNKASKAIQEKAIAV
jgi:hypothetical protein